jgi:pyruvate,water dikinase
MVLKAELIKGQGGGGSTSVIGEVSVGRITSPGQVLVARMTDPAMLNDMRQAAAVVTDEGGVLCHAAIVCLSLGIPFVVGTRTATELLADGAVVEVNPVTGEVAVL